MKALSLSIVFILLLVQCFAQADSVHHTQGRFSAYLDRSTATRAYQMTCVGVPLVIGGLIVKGQDAKFRTLRNGYTSSFAHNYDDYLQYAPAALLLGLKIGGVKGRSSWGRMLVSSAFSSALMAGTVTSLKYATQVMRPNGANRHSFPSGHTATAFMTATILHKEYGQRSPWYSIGGYTIATITGISRQLNNRHWLSDVMVGAGIGILTAEVGYLLADLIFKERGITHYDTHYTFDRYRNPSFLGIYLGFNIAPGTYTLQEDMRVRLMSGAHIGIEGAWFITPYVGIGGRLTAANMSVKVNDQLQNDSFESASASGGLYLSYPISLRWQVGSKVVAGYHHYKTCTTEFGEIGGRGGYDLGTGTWLNYWANESLGVRFCFDYTFAPPMSRSAWERMHLLTFGATMNIAF